MSEELCRKLGYHFSNQKILKTALTHCSSDDNNNERLEFLGDSIVNFIIAEALYQQFPHAQEGNLSRWRATLINRDALGNMARQFQLGRYLFLGPGELKSGGGERLSILSCGMEAIIGAIYLDGGFAVTRECILRWYAPLLESLSSSTNHKDPKTNLQEYLQSLHQALPTYFVESVEGESHQQTFAVSCCVEGISQKAFGKGTSRRRAEQEAAELMLGIVKNEFK
jgi:ribonuclease-3